MINICFSQEFCMIYVGFLNFSFLHHFLFLIYILLNISFCCLMIFIWFVNHGCQELDFLTEAKNSERCLENFRKFSPHIANYVYAPKVYWTLSTSKLLTMEFMDGAYINDVKSIKKLGIHPHELSTLVSFCLWVSL